MAPINEEEDFGRTLYQLMALLLAMGHVVLFPANRRAPRRECRALDSAKKFAKPQHGYPKHPALSHVQRTGNNATVDI